MYRMKRVALFLLLFFLIPMISTTYASDKQTGKLLLELAESKQQLAAFQEAITFANQAIIAFNQLADKDEEARQLLAKTHYLKANVMNSVGKSKETIREELSQAMMANPEYTPPGNLISHPNIRALINEAKKQYSRVVNATFEKATALLAAKKYCEAADALETIREKHSNPGLVNNFLLIARDGCPKPSSDTARSASRKAPAHQAAPKPASHTNSGRIAIFPTLTKPGESHLSKIVDQDTLFRRLKEKLPKYEYSVIDKEDTIKLQKRYDFISPVTFIVKSSTEPYFEGGKDLLDGIFNVMKGQKIETFYGKLIPSKRNILKEIGREGKFGYILLVYIEGKTTATNDPRMDMFLNLYDLADIEKPVIMESWGNIRARESHERYDEISNLLAGSLK